MNKNQQKLEQIKLIEKIIRTAGQISIDKFRAMIEYNFGLSRQKIKEILETLENMDIIEYREDIIKYKEKTAEQVKKEVEKELKDSKPEA